MAIYLKNIEVFSPTVLYESALVGFIAANRGWSQIGAHAFCYAPAVTEVDKQTLKVARRVDLRVGNVLSWRDLLAAELLE